MNKVDDAIIRRRFTADVNRIGTRTGVYIRGGTRSQNVDGVIVRSLIDRGRRPIIDNVNRVAATLTVDNRSSRIRRQIHRVGARAAVQCRCGSRTGVADGECVSTIAQRDGQHAQAAISNARTDHAETFDSRGVQCADCRRVTRVIHAHSCCPTAGDGQRAFDILNYAASVSGRRIATNVNGIRAQVGVDNRRTARAGDIQNIGSRTQLEIEVADVRVTQRTVAAK